MENLQGCPFPLHQLSSRLVANGFYILEPHELIFYRTFAAQRFVRHICISKAGTCLYIHFSIFFPRNNVSGQKKEKNNPHYHLFDDVSLIVFKRSRIEKENIWMCDGLVSFDFAVGCRGAEDSGRTSNFSRTNDFNRSGRVIAWKRRQQCTHTHVHM